jgi:hypothetical protein
LQPSSRRAKPIHIGQRLRARFRLKVLSLDRQTYQFRDLSVSHESVIRALGAYGNHQYPGFSDAPLDAFHHLRSDLENFMQTFIVGSDEALYSLLELAQQREARPKGTEGIP